MRSFLLQQGYDSSRIRVVYNGAADPLTRPLPTALRQRLGLSADALLFGVLARFLRDKGQDLAIAALARCGTGNHLALIGADAGGGPDL